MAATVTRIESDLYDSAQRMGSVMSRSAAQQINHWARIGREIEASDELRPREIARVLSGAESYDVLTAREKAVVRAEWDERATRARLDLNFEAELEAAGTDWVEGTDDGAVVRRGVTRRDGD